MTTPENAAFYRDVFGMPSEVADHIDDQVPDLEPVSPDEADRMLKAAGVDTE